MSLKNSLRQSIKKFVFGGDRLSNRFFLAQIEPQQEVTVWLLVDGKPIDVTRRHCEASGIPFTICIEFARGHAPAENTHFKLRLSENGGEHRVLSEIDLEYREMLECGESEFLFFHSGDSVNYCLPLLKRWTHNLWYGYVAFRRMAKITVPAKQRHAMTALFCCPRPVSLISVRDDQGNGNIYPLNVMGDLNHGFFGFCLKHGHLPEKFVQRAGRVVLSSVPMQQAPIAYLLASNHNRPFVDWEQLPFRTSPSQVFKFPVPLFACRVRELQVEKIHQLGYHTFFLARVVSDEQRERVRELCVAHGYFQDWRVRNLGINKMQADAEDLYVRAPISREDAELLSERFGEEQAIAKAMSRNDKGTTSPKYIGDAEPRRIDLAASSASQPSDIMIEQSIPNFFIAGAAKTGTTSLYHYLKQHPDIFMSPIKEPCYFAFEMRPKNFSPEIGIRTQAAMDNLRGQLKRGLEVGLGAGIVELREDYLKLFKGVKGERAIGEASVSYLWSATAAKEIAAFNPSAKIILILRHPAERAFSNYIYYLSDGHISHSFRKHIELCLKNDGTMGFYRPFLDVGLYGEQIDRLLGHISREQVRVWLYEETTANPDKVFREVLTFLGVDPDFKPDRSHRHLKMHVPRIAGIVPILRWGKSWQHFTPESVRHVFKKIFYRKPGSMTMSAEDRRLLVNYYRDDVKKLERIIDRDLSSWIQ